MRALLADWLIEVCAEFLLHRETYYMALNFVDRYLSVKLNVAKSNLQSIGVTVSQRSSTRHTHTHRYNTHAHSTPPRVRFVARLPPSGCNCVS